MSQDYLCAEARTIYNNLRQRLPDHLIMEPVIFGEAVRLIMENKEPQCIVDIYFSNFPVPGGTHVLTAANGRRWRFADYHYFHYQPDYTANLLVMSLNGQLSARLGCNPLDCIRDIERRILHARGGRVELDVLERLREYN
jgi:hypothetical protein